jgi:tetratricopeptide (TPR) repeat protein
LWGQDKDENAITFLNVYLEKRPESVVALRLRMVLFGLLGRYPDMAADANALVRMHSDDPAVYIWRGLAGLFLNQFDRSLADLERAAGYEEVSVWAEVVAGLALTWIGSPGEAIGHLDVALGRAPDLVVALLARATAYAASDDKGAAVDDITRVIEIEPENADALAVRGQYYGAMGQFAAAADDFKHAMDLAGRSPQMNLLWGIARAQQRNLEAAASTGEMPPEEIATESGSEAESGTLSNERVQEWFSRYVYPRSPDASAQDSISPSPRP